MRIFLIEENAFIQFGEGYLLRICTKTELDEADDERIRQMVIEAVAQRKYCSIEASKKHTIN